MRKAPVSIPVGGTVWEGLGHVACWRRCSLVKGGMPLGDGPSLSLLPVYQYVRLPATAPVLCLLAFCHDACRPVI